MTRGVSAGFGPMIHDFHFGAKAKERADFERSSGQISTRSLASAEKLNGANCKACHSNGTIDLDQVPAFTMMTKAGVPIE